MACTVFPNPHAEDAAEPAPALGAEADLTRGNVFVLGAALPRVAVNVVIVALIWDMQMVGAILFRADGIEVVHSAYDQGSWSGDHCIGRVPKPEKSLDGTDCRTKDFQRPQRIPRHEH
eukprot:8439765-Lingulodinium_polyedra.AAC.1